ncbi:hypothetical protein ACRE1S_04185 [Helicobacter himalayensis]|uniref:hypothetical protein n=1 Tax=Helicobacter himalayensis TaxID=1591088 RepID=UPI003D6DC362
MWIKRDYKFPKCGAKQARRKVFQCGRAENKPLFYCLRVCEESKRGDFGDISLALNMTKKRGLENIEQRLRMIREGLS